MILCVTLLFIKYGFAQVSSGWPAPPVYSGSGSGPDYPSAVVVDAAGNVFVGGSETELGITDKDWVIMKYDASGLEVPGWPKKFPNSGNDSLAAMKIDGLGNLYTTGRFMFGSSSGGRQAEYFTIKMSGATGAILWSRRYSLKPGSGFDQALAIAIDGEGNVYVTGESETSASTLDVVTIKYPHNSSGIEEPSEPPQSAEWVHRYDGNNSNGSDGGTCIAIASNGDALVGGYSAGAGSSFDFITFRVKYDGTKADKADTVWTERFNNSPINLIDKVVGIAVDKNDDAIVTGASKSSAQNDFRTIKYRFSDGAVLWSVKYNYFANDEPVGIVADKNNFIYVTGKSNRGDAKDNILTIKYKPATGDTVWTKSTNGPTTQSIDAATGILLTDAIYVSGTVSADTLNGLKNFVIIKYDTANGNEIWRSYANNSAEFNDDIATAMTSDAANSFYVTGTSKTSTGDLNFLTQKFVQSTAIGGQMFDDYDGDTLTSSDQIPFNNFKITRLTTAGAFVESTRTNEFGFYSFKNLGFQPATFDIVCDSVSPYNYAASPGLGGVSSTVIGTRKIRVHIDTSGQHGISLLNNFYNLQDPRFCTIPPESLVISMGSTKGATIKPGKPIKGIVNWINVRDTAWVRTDLLATLGMLVGIPQPAGNTTYGWTWIEKKYKNGVTKDKNAKTALKFLPAKKEILLETHLLPEAAAKCFALYGGKPWPMSKGGYVKKPDWKKHKNHLAMQLIGLRFGLWASEGATTPEGLGDLQYLDTATNQMDLFDGLTIYEIADMADSALTYCDRGYDLNDFDSMLTLINTTFKGTTDTLKTIPLRVFGNVRLRDVDNFRKIFAGKERKHSARVSLRNIPSHYSLEQNYPNPFNPTTTIRFETGKANDVSLKLYNILGQEVTTLIRNDELEVGMHELQFDASQFSTGMYFYRLSGKDENGKKFSISKKMMMLK
jgi:hypothetical protein